MINNLDQILEWINRIRPIYGAPPITELMKGQACNGNHCPLANSLVSETHGAYQVDISYTHWIIYMSYQLEYESNEFAYTLTDELEDGKYLYRLIGPIPDFIRDFLVNIDSNEYPELAEYTEDTENSFDEGEENTIKYEQTFVSKREWLLEEEDEEWEPDYYEDDLGSWLF